MSVGRAKKMGALRPPWMLNPLLPTSRSYRAAVASTAMWPTSAPRLLAHVRVHLNAGCPSAQLRVLPSVGMPIGAKSRTRRRDAVVHPIADTRPAPFVGHRASLHEVRRAKNPSCAARLLRCTKQRPTRPSSCVFDSRALNPLPWRAKLGIFTLPVDNLVDESEASAWAQGFLADLLDWPNFDRQGFFGNSVGYGILPSSDSSIVRNVVAPRCQVPIVDSCSRWSRPRGGSKVGIASEQSDYPTNCRPIGNGHPLSCGCSRRHPCRRS